jgi:hypothetical protein
MQIDSHQAEWKQDPWLIHQYEPYLHLLACEAEFFQLQAGKGFSCALLCVLVVITFVFAEHIQIPPTISSNSFSAPPDKRLLMNKLLSNWHLIASVGIIASLKCNVSSRRFLCLFSLVFG